MPVSAHSPPHHQSVLGTRTLPAPPGPRPTTPRTQSPEGQPYDPRLPRNAPWTAYVLRRNAGGPRTGMSVCPFGRPGENRAVASTAPSVVEPSRAPRGGALRFPPLRRSLGRAPSEALLSQENPRRYFMTTSCRVPDRRVLGFGLGRAALPPSDGTAQASRACAPKATHSPSRELS
jgi:hypothetical protein